MTQPTSQQGPSIKRGRNSSMKWVIVIVVVVVVIAGIGVALTYHPPKQKQTPALSLSPTSAASAAQAGTNITFYPGLPTSAVFTKLVWNFGNGHTTTVTSGNGVVSYAYPSPGIYLVSVSAYNSTSSVNSNTSLLAISVSNSLSANSGAIYGPVEIMGSSQNGNQTLSVGGWMNMTYAGNSSSPPITVGSEVPSNLAYTVQSFVWTINNETQTIQDNNTGYPENVNLTFSTTGLNYVSLVTTTSASGGLTATGTYVVTIAVGDYQVGKIISGVTTNKNMVINAEYMPGGFVTIDPAIDYEPAGYEVMDQIYQPLVYFIGESSSSYNPVIAKYVPTVANGGVTTGAFVGTSSPALNYTFYINTSLSFSNGDHVTPYDVYVSVLRTLLFANSPNDPGWLIAHVLLPADSIYGPFNESFYWIHHAVTWNNSTESVTFHLLPSNPTWLPNATAEYGGQSFGSLNQSYQVQSYGGSLNFLQFIAGIPATYVLDYNWLKSMDALPSNTTASYAYYANTSTSPGFLSNWNQKLHYDAMGTGPYQISLMQAPSEVVLSVNPHYNATPGMPAKSSLIKKVMIEYMSNIGIAQEQIESGYAQFATDAFPPSSASTAVSFITKGVLSSAQVKLIATDGLGINLDVNVTGTKIYDSSTNIPAGFFDNLSVRQAFSYAFNNSYHVNVANTANGIPYAENLTGMFPAGIANAPTNLTNPYPYNMKLAAHYWNQTPYAKNGTALYFPIFMQEGVPSWDQMITVWISALSQMSGGQIHAKLVDIPWPTMSSYFSVLGGNPMPIFYANWYEDYPDPTDFAAPYYQEGGYYSLPISLAATNVFNPTTEPSQWSNITKMWNILDAAAGETNSTQRTLMYYVADKIAVDLAFYVGYDQPVLPIFYSSSILGSSLVPSLNPSMAGEIVYYALQYS